MSMEYPKKLMTGSMVIVIFVLVVSLSSWYVWNEIYFGDVCSCAVPLPILIPVLASIGLLVGTLLYYMFSPTFEKAPVCREAILKLLDPVEREIVSCLIESGGEASQASIGKSTGMSKVRVFRCLEKLVVRGIVEKESHGKTNMVRLSQDLKGLMPRQ
jgi:hypothetical protein